MRRLGGAGLALAITAAAVVGAGVGAAAENYLREAHHNNKIAIRGCVIRFDERDDAGKTVPRIHANPSHYCVGVSSIAVNPDNGDLEVRSATKGPIVSLAVSPDETLTSRGISCGGSGGGGITRIRCFDRDGVRLRADGPELYGTYSNLWLTWFTWQDK
ncbi:MAG TPA: hypothetical protein VI076_13325 [Actinopolymorphaceae bacterium]